jgi:soluble lytic murein transglycosylase-like protein
MDLEKLVDDVTEKYDLDESWIKAIITQESQWKPWAIRYEPNYVWTYKPELFSKNPLISYATELASQKMSWGLGQIMGALAREQGHTGFIAELIKPEINIKHICLRLVDLKKYSNEAPDIFAMYNGGPGARIKINSRYRNESYVNAVMTHLQKYKS